MEKVFLVTSGSYSDYRVSAVCSTREKAEKIANAYADCDIEEHPVDYPHVKAQSGQIRFFVVLSRNGEALRIGKSSYLTDEEPQETTFYLGGNPLCLCLECWALSKEHALKIAGEYLTMTLARGDWDTSSDEGE